MAEHGNEIRPQSLLLFQAGSHVIEGPRELSQLILGQNGNRIADPLARDGADALAELSQRAVHGMCEIKGSHQAYQDGDPQTDHAVTNGHSPLGGHPEHFDFDLVLIVGACFRDPVDPFIDNIFLDPQPLGRILQLRGLRRGGNRRLVVPVQLIPYDRPARLQIEGQNDVQVLLEFPLCRDEIALVIFLLQEVVLVLVLLHPQQAVDQLLCRRGDSIVLVYNIIRHLDDVLNMHKQQEDCTGENGYQRKVPQKKLNHNPGLGFHGIATRTFLNEVWTDFSILTENGVSRGG